MDWFAFWVLLIAAAIAGLCWADSYIGEDNRRGAVSVWKVLLYTVGALALAMLGGLGFWPGLGVVE